jgi:5'-phosphate synthase pdxT subunit
MVFIRAPYISEASDKVEILATVNDRIVAARQGNFLATAFHPELTNDLSVHKYFINMISAN